MTKSAFDVIKSFDHLSMDWFTQHALCDIKTRYVRAVRTVFVSSVSFGDPYFCLLRRGDCSKSSDKSCCYTDDSFALTIPRLCSFFGFGSGDCDYVTFRKGYGRRMLARGRRAYELWLRGWSFEEA